MKLNECIEFIQASDGGGVFTDENRKDFGFAQNILRLGRAMAIKTLHANNNLQSDIYFQTAKLFREDDLQEDDCYTLFRTPRILTVNSVVDGQSYMGSPNDNKNWRRVKSAAQLANQSRQRLGGMRDDVIYYMLNPRNDTVKVFNPDIKKCTQYAIFEDPLHPLLNFNPQLDEYPVTLECLGLIEQYIREGIVTHMLRQMPEMRPNSAPDITVNLQPNQM